MSIRFTRAASVALLAAVLAACGEDAAGPGPFEPIPGGAQTPPIPAAVTWHAEARALVSAGGLNPLAAGRVYAALGVAQHRAVRNADAQLPVEPVPPAPPTTGIPSDPGAGMYGPGGRARYEARRGAVAGASARLLGHLFPAAIASIQQKLAEQAAAGRGEVHPAFTEGERIGRAAGTEMIAHLAADGFTTPWNGTVPVGPGIWVPNALPPAGGMLGGVTPYFMTTGAQFRPAPPPAFGSAAFLADVQEVLTMTANLTPEQLASALYWDMPGGTPTPIGFWDGVAGDYIVDHGLDELAAVEVFAMTQAATFDALIGCWEAKYHYWTLRPSQANAAISLAFGLPNHPSYPSGHSCASAAAARVLTHYFPDEASELNGWVEESGLSRMLAGIHYRFDITAGQQLGRNVADLALSMGLN